MTSLAQVEVIRSRSINRPQRRRQQSLLVTLLRSLRATLVSIGNALRSQRIVKIATRTYMPLPRVGDNGDFL